MSSALTDALNFFKVSDDPKDKLRRTVSVSRSSASSAGKPPLDAAAVEPVADYELLKLRNGTERVPSVALSEADRLKWLKAGRPDLNKNLLNEGVVGSLPRPVTLADRENIRNSVPLSPVLDVILGAKPEHLSAATPEAQKRRLRLLSGSILVVVCAGYSGKRFIYKKAKDLGIRMFMLDGPEHWARGLEKEGIVEKYYPLDFSEPDAVYDKCVAIVKTISEEYGQVDGIMSFLDLAQPLVARLCDALGYPGNHAEAVDLARNKQKTRAALETAKVPTPSFMLIAQPDQIPEAAEKVGFPAVIKPISGAASIGVVRVDNLEELKTNYKRIVSDLSKTMYKDGSIVTLDEADDVDTSQGKALEVNFDIMMEQYLDGPEVDVDCVMHDGVVRYSNVIDNWPTEEPWFLETGSNAPSILSEQQQAELKSMAADCLRAVGLTHGVHHVELKYTSKGPRLIEINCRMGGGCVRDENMMQTGVDLVEEQLLASVGLPVNPPVAKEPLHKVAEFSVNAPRSGILTNVDCLLKWEDDPDVVYCRALADVGTKVTSSKDGLPTWIAEVMVTSKTSVEDAITKVTKIVEDINTNIGIQTEITKVEE